MSERSELRKHRGVLIREMNVSPQRADELLDLIEAEAETEAVAR